MTCLMFDERSAALLFHFGRVLRKRNRGHIMIGRFPQYLRFVTSRAHNTILWTQTLYLPSHCALVAMVTIRKRERWAWPMSMKACLFDVTVRGYVVTLTWASDRLHIPRDDWNVKL